MLLILRGHGIFLGLSLVWVGAVFGAVWTDSVLSWICGFLYAAYDTALTAYIAWKTYPLAGRRPVMQDTATISIGVIVPVRNEACVIVTTLQRLLAQTDQADQIIIVNDGSTDQTAAVLRHDYPHLSIVHKTHSGKADSLNQACALLHTDVVVTVDADTWLAPDALAAIRRAFACESALAAACGILTPHCAPGVRGSLFLWFQTYEYLRAFLARAAWMQHNALLLVSGAFAAYRRDVLLRIGGYDGHSFVEDYELIHRLHRYAAEHRLDWRVRVLPDARAQTDAPATVRAFLDQRRRWFAGFLQTQYQYRAMHGNAQYGALGTLLLPIKEADTLQPLYGMTAIVLLCIFVIRSSPFVALILWVISIQFLLGLLYLLWAIWLYHRWLGVPVQRYTWLMAPFSALLEPFSFQLLRYVGALWGWVMVFTGRQDWKTHRMGMH